MASVVEIKLVAVASLVGLCQVNMSQLVYVIHADCCPWQESSCNVAFHSEDFLAIILILVRFLMYSKKRLTNVPLCNDDHFLLR